MLFTTDRALRVVHENVLYLEQLMFTCMFFTFLLKQCKMLLSWIQVFHIQLEQPVIVHAISLPLLLTGTIYPSILLKLKIMKLACFAEDFEIACPDHLETEPGVVSMSLRLLFYSLDRADDTTKYKIW